MDLYNTRKRYAVIESSDLMRNTLWLASCFSKIKKPNKHCSGNQSGGSARYKRNIQNRKIQIKRVLGVMKYTHWLVDHYKVTQ